MKKRVIQFFSSITEALLLIQLGAHTVLAPERDLGRGLLAVVMEDVTRVEGWTIQMQRNGGIRMAGILHAM